VLDLKLIRDNPDVLQKALADRGQGADDVEALLASILRLDTERRQTLTTLQEAQSRRNQISKDVGKAKAAKDEALAQKLMAEIGDLKDRIAQGETREKEISAELDALLAGIPNVPAADVPLGGEEANKELRRSGKPREFNFEPKHHFELGEALGLMDFETAAKLSGSRFVVLKGALARMERALAAFMLDLHTAPATDKSGGYQEVVPPYLVRDNAVYGTAQLPKFASDLFNAKQEEIIGADEAIARIGSPAGTIHFEFHGPRAVDLHRAYYGNGKNTGRVHLDHPIANGDGTLTGIMPLVETSRWLIPTSEVPLTNLVSGDIVELEKLPIRVTAHTPCFRSEAGAAGKDTRGMIRLHQFSKVELVSITTQEQSEEEHERMTRCAETVLEKLGLPYRTIVLATGDMGFSAKKTYDIEVWLPGQNAYREISSCSNCGDFQARRMNARYRPKDAKDLRFVHTLNGSGLAVGRTLVAVLENYQEKDGSIRVPDVLVPYMGGMEVIKA
jgi:seryl-tRNA synthetase